MELVATFSFPHDAKLAQQLLESAGIPAFLRGENVNRLNIGYQIADGGQHLYVPTGVAEEAREILESQVSQNELEAQAEAAGHREDI